MDDFSVSDYSVLCVNRATNPFTDIQGWGFSYGGSDTGADRVKGFIRTNVCNDEGIQSRMLNSVSNHQEIMQVATTDASYEWFEDRLPNGIVNVGSPEHGSIGKHSEYLAKAGGFAIQELPFDLMFGGDYISTRKAQYVHIKAQEAGFTEGGLRHLLSEYGCYSTKQIRKRVYGGILYRVESKANASYYNSLFDRMVFRILDKYKHYE